MRFFLEKSFDEVAELERMIEDLQSQRLVASRFDSNQRNASLRWSILNEMTNEMTDARINEGGSEQQARVVIARQMTQQDQIQCVAHRCPLAMVPGCDSSVSDVRNFLNNQFLFYSTSIPCKKKHLNLKANILVLLSKIELCLSLPIDVDDQKWMLNSAFQKLQDAQEKKKQNYCRGIIFGALSKFINDLKGIENHFEHLIANHFEHLDEEDDCHLLRASEVTP